MLKSGIQAIRRKDLLFIAENEHSVKRFKPWLGDAFSFLYDYIMENSIFPKKFGGDVTIHYEILSGELHDVQRKHVLELATGTGSAVNFLPVDNKYTGTDISSGLLKKAVKNFRRAGFKKAEFYVAPADELPFADDTFDVCICILSLNFFDDIEKVLGEVRRVLRRSGKMVCSVPVPERNTLQSTIRGTLYSEVELKKICQEQGFGYASVPRQNGALLYFTATLQ